jgi:hypothetical protein
MLTKKIKVMKLIKVTSLSTGKPIYINIEHIGHLYRSISSKTEHTRIGVTNHNNGGFEVVESTEQIFKLIEKTKSISYIEQQTNDQKIMTEFIIPKETQELPLEMDTNDFNIKPTIIGELDTDFSSVKGGDFNCVKFFAIDRLSLSDLRLHIIHLSLKKILCSH